MDILTTLLSVIFEGVDPSLLLAGQIYLSFIALGLSFTIAGLFIDFFDDILDSTLGIFDGLTDIFDSGDDVIGFHGLGGLTIGSFISCFGATGLLLTIYNIQPIVSAPTSAFISLLLSFIVFKVACSIFTESTVTSKQSDLLNQEAIVTVQIPSNGVGSIRYTRNGTHSMLAITSKNKSIDRNQSVKIVKLVGTKAFVKPVLIES